MSDLATLIASIIACVACGDPDPNDVEVEALDQVGLHQHFEAAARRRRIAVDVVAAIRRAQRLGPLRLVGGEIGRGQQAAVLLEEALELLRDVALVETIERRLDRLRSRRLLRERLLLGVDQLAQRRGVIGILQQLAGLERLAVRQEDLRRRRILAAGWSCRDRSTARASGRSDSPSPRTRSPARTRRRCSSCPCDRAARDSRRDCRGRCRPSCRR